MTLELRLRPEAELDLAEAALWYEEQGADIADVMAKGDTDWKGIACAVYPASLSGSLNSSHDTLK